MAKSELRSFRPRVRNRVSISEFDPTRTKQSDAAAADINNIMKRFGGVQNIPQIPLKFGSRVDFPDLQSALNAVIDGENAFATLDGSIRRYFDNDFIKFDKFMADPANAAEAIRLGILVERPAPVPDPVVEAMNGIRSDLKASRSRKPAEE